VVRDAVKELAEHAETVVSRLYLDNVLFPHPSESPDLQAKIDAIAPAVKTEETAALMTHDGDEEIPF
jgi:hypothetical protein